MTSAIDPTVPVYGKPTTQSVRDNFQRAHDEITSLQNTSATVTQLANYLPLAGGIMSGLVTLSGPPSVALNPATKGYVDAAVNAITTGYLSLSGGTLTGDLHVTPGLVQIGSSASTQPVNLKWTNNAFSIALIEDATTLHFSLTAASDPNGPYVGTKRPLSVDLATARLDLDPGGAGATFGGTVTLKADPTVALGAATKGYVDGAPFLKLAGGTMTGPLTLSRDPVGALEAATRQYVNASISGAVGITEAPNDAFSYGRTALDWRKVVPMLGATNELATVENTTTSKAPVITGYVTAQNAASDYIQIQPYRLLLPDANGNNSDGAAIALRGKTHTTPNQVDIISGNVAAGYKAWSFKPDGSMATPGNVTVAGTVALNSPGGVPLSVTVPSGNAAYTQWTITGQRTWWAGVATNGWFQITDQSAAGARYQIDTSGVHTLAGGNVYVQQQMFVQCGQGIGDYYLGRVSNLRILNFANNWYLSWRESDGLLFWTAGGNTRWQVDGSGNMQCSGNVNGANVYGGTTQGNYLRSTGDAQVDGNFNAGGNSQANWIHSRGDVVADGVLYAGNGPWVALPNNWGYRFGRDPGNGTFTVYENGQWNFQARTNGDCQARTGMYANYLKDYGDLSVDGNAYINGFISAGSNGVQYPSWASNHVGWGWTGGTLNCFIDWNVVGNIFSDARVKSVVGDYDRGLAELRQLKPVRYKLKGNERGVVPATVENREEEQQRVLDAPSINDTGKMHVGVLAQDAERILPEMFRTEATYIDGELVEDVRLLDDGPWLTWALVNAVRELDARLAKVERT